MSKYILFEWIVPIGFALLSAGLVVFIIEINEWFGRKEDKRQERLKNEKLQPAKENKKRRWKCERDDSRPMPEVRRGNYSFRVLSDIARLQSSYERETIQTVHRHRCWKRECNDSIMRQLLWRILGR